MFVCSVNVTNIFLHFDSPLCGTSVAQKWGKGGGGDTSVYNNYTASVVYNTFYRLAADRQEYCFTKDYYYYYFF